MISKMTERYILWGKFNPNLKRQFNIEMITKETETNILCGEIWNRNWKRQFSIELITKITQAYILSWDISNSNWKKKQFSLEIIAKMAESNIHCENVCFWVENVLNHGAFRRRFERYF